MRRWLERFTFTFLILGTWLLYEAYAIHTGRNPGTPTRANTYIALGFALLVLGILSLKLRHTPRN